MATKTYACRLLTQVSATERIGDMPQNQFIGSADAALALGIDRSTLIRWIAAGKLTPLGRISDTPTGAHLFRRVDVERLAKKRTAA